MLEVSHLTCARGERTLFQDVSFTLQARGLLHVAGANGSGKTSLLRILCGLGAADDGEVRWRGEPARGAREAYWRELVYLGHAPALKDDLTPIENMRVACVLAGRPVSDADVRDALTRFGLAACMDLPARALSQGQKRRSVMARLALSTQVPLWILDEPFSALDAAAVSHLEQLIVAYVDGGGSAIFTTHQQAAIAPRVTQRLDLDAVREPAC